MPSSGRLIAAAREANLENLRELLSGTEYRGGRNDDVTDDDIHKALFAVAHTGGSCAAEACRLLWEGLKSEKQMYCRSSMPRSDSPLHHSVQRGQLELVRLFIEEFHWNIDQLSRYDETPLMLATNSGEAMTRYLLESGAKVDIGIPYGPLFEAVRCNRTSVARLLLVEYQVDPNLYRRPAHEAEDYWQHDVNPRITDVAIRNGNAEMLCLLLERGADVGIRNRDYHAATPWGTSLNILLVYPNNSRSTKLNICRMLVEHAKEEKDTAAGAATVAFMRASYYFANEQSDTESCEIFLQAGMISIVPRALYWAVQNVNEPLCRLLVQYGFDPFSEEKHKSEDEDEEEEDDDTSEDEEEDDDTSEDEEDEGEGDDDDENKEHAAAPFIAAARQSDTNIFDYILGVWDERFSGTGGKNDNGDYPLHVVCSDPGVSLQAIQVLVDHRQEEAKDVVVAMVDVKQGLLPVHAAARWGASLDVIYCLLQHYPSVLRHVGNTPIVGQSRLAAVVGDAKDSTVESSLEPTCSDEDWKACGPVKKKAKQG